MLSTISSTISSKTKSANSIKTSAFSSSNYYHLYSFSYISVNRSLPNLSSLINAIYLYKKNYLYFWRTVVDNICEWRFDIVFGFFLFLFFNISRLLKFVNYSAEKTAPLGCFVSNVCFYEIYVV